MTLEISYFCFSKSKCIEDTYKKSFRISFRNTIAYNQAIVEISSTIVSKEQLYLKIQLTRQTYCLLFKDKLVHVEILSKAKLLTRHLDRNEAKLSVAERSHTFALAKVNVSKIHTKNLLGFLSETLLLVKKLTMYFKTYYSQKN